MRHARLITLLGLALMLSVAARALWSQESEEEAAETGSSASAGSAEAQPAGKEKPAEKGKEQKAPEEKPVVTHHEIRVEGKVLKYTATAGTLPIKNADGETEAHIFFIAYTLDNPGAGQGDSSDWTRRPSSSSIMTTRGSTRPTWFSSIPWGRDTAAPPRRNWARSSGASKATSSRSASSSAFTSRATNAGLHRCSWWVKATERRAPPASPATCSTTALLSTESSSSLRC